MASARSSSLRTRDVWRHFIQRVARRALITMYLTAYRQSRAGRIKDDTTGEWDRLLQHYRSTDPQSQHVDAAELAMKRLAEP